MTSLPYQSSTSGALRQVETDTIRGQLSRESASLAMNKQGQSLIERIQAYLWGGSEN